MGEVALGSMTGRRDWRTAGGVVPCPFRASPCKTCRNRGSFYFESGIESSIESGYIQDHALSLKMVALVQSDSGGDDGARMGEMEFKHC